MTGRFEVFDEGDGTFTLYADTRMLVSGSIIDLQDLEVEARRVLLRIFQNEDTPARHT